MIKKRFVLLIIALLTSLFLFSCGNAVSLPPPTLLEPIAGKIETVFVSRGTVESLLILPGITRVPVVAARLETGTGKIGGLYAFPGDIVTQGQLLARLETPELDTQIKDLEETLENTLALNRLYLEEISAQIRLFGSAGSNNPQVRLLRLDRQYAAARHELEVENLEKQLEVLRYEKEQTEIYAPISGEIVQSVRLGERIYAMGAVMFIADEGNVFVEFIGERNVRWDVPMQLKGEIAGSVYDLRPIRHTASDHVGFRTFNVEPPIRFDIIGGSPGAIAAGEPVFIRQYFAHEEDTLRLPEYALYRDIDGVFVYRIRDGEQEIVHVTVGVVTDIFVQILDGLDEGDEIVVRQ
ncbi:MAG: efflux RND transporter periplasmic adaptor subunit [Oscillospiraceae bacterium]|nr:efflux RND transporter periplasmic adaptor subunit [Oscillospiraceae bacterium]